MKSSDSGKNICCRDQYHKLAHDRYDHTEYCLSKCLEHSTRNNTEPCDQVMDTNNPKCRHTDRVSNKIKPMQVRQNATVILNLIV